MKEIARLSGALALAAALMFAAAFVAAVEAPAPMFSLCAVE